MLKMEQVHVIRHKVHIEGQSIRQVAKAMQLSRTTVAKYLNQSVPARRESPPRPAPARERIRQRIDELVEEWRHRTTEKQRITGTRLHRQLLEESLTVGKTTVYEVLRERRRRSAEVYIPLIHRAGDAAQVDFFEVTVETGGAQRAVWKFVLRLMYSGYDFAWLYERCDQLSFLDAHVRAFAFFGGVPKRCIYDNLSAAVRRRLHLHHVERQLTAAFAALSSHYLFEPCFARPGEGHDKGGVEARGKGIRLQHLTPIPQGQTLSEIARALLDGLTQHAQRKRHPEGELVADRFTRERTALRELPAVEFPARVVRQLSVSSSATVVVDGATYSMPSRWARLDVTAYIGVTDLRFVCQGQTETHPRVAAGRKSVRYRHYLPELSRKPQAVRQVAPELVAELGEPYGRLWQLLEGAHGGLEAARVLARLLAVIDREGEEVVSAALSRALRQSPRFEPHAPAACVAQATRAVAVPEALRFYNVEAGHAADYDWLLETGGVR
ncbi:MAG: IS21 family transposase [Burkholderiaceae bacterium]